MNVIIIGAGLSGLTVAYLLRQDDIQVTILEARERLGGRIWTKTVEAVPVEAGATWFGKKHTNLVRLLEDLEVGYFEQYTEGVSLIGSPYDSSLQQFYVPRDEPPSYRIEGGSSALIHALSQTIDASSIHLNSPVQEIDFTGKQCVLKTKSNLSFEADKVVSTLPPRLFASALSIKPELPNAWASVAANTQTWMGRSVKFFVTYKKRFWVDSGFSGAAFRQGGIIPEMYDHTNSDGTKIALKGFLSDHATRLSYEERRAAVIKQLVHYFGPEAKQALQYGDVLWSRDPHTNVFELPDLFPHQNNGHKVLREPLFDGRLLHGGSETADVFPGYMDGAVNAAQHIAKRIKA